MPPTVNDVRLLIVADDPLVRAGLSTLLDGRPGLLVAGQTGGDAEPAQIDVYRPDVLLWDLGWDPSRSLDRLADPHIQLPIVALLSDASQARDAWAARACSLLPRQAKAEELLAALQAAAQGLVVLAPELAGALRPARSSSPLPAQLTQRELEVLQLLTEGLSNKAIAGRLGISEHTVKFHVNAIMGKLDAESRTDAVVRATRLGLVIL